MKINKSTARSEITGRALNLKQHSLETHCLDIHHVHISQRYHTSATAPTHFAEDTNSVRKASIALRKRPLATLLLPLFLDLHDKSLDFSNATHSRDRWRLSEIPLAAGVPMICTWLRGRLLSRGGELEALLAEKLGALRLAKRFSLWKGGDVDVDEDVLDVIDEFKSPEKRWLMGKRGSRPVDVTLGEWNTRPSVRMRRTRMVKVRT